MTPAEALKKIHASMDAILWRENQPQFAGAFAHARPLIKVDAQCDTAYVDTKGNITVGLELATSLPPKQLGYVIAHEVCHPMLDHFQRMPKGADARLWNIAGDVVINEPIFTDGGADALPDWVVRAPEDYNGPLQTEPIYAWLRQNPDKAPKPARSASGKPLPGAGCGAEPPPGADGAGGTDPGDAVWAQIAAEARAIDAIVGKGSAVCSVIAPGKSYYNFAELLRFGARQADTGAGRSERTYARASRRDVAPGIILPGQAGGTSLFAVVIDASSSMNRDWIGRIEAEVLRLAKEFKRTKFYLVTHTAHVVWSGWIEGKSAEASASAATAFAGGTCVGPAYDALAKVSKRWDAILHFTDCEVETPWPIAPTRKLIIGAFGSGAYRPWSAPPSGATVIPCRDPGGV